MPLSARFALVQHHVVHRVGFDDDMMRGPSEVIADFRMDSVWLSDGNAEFHASIILSICSLKPALLSRNIATPFGVHHACLMRPRKCRKVCLSPQERVFKPAGIPHRQLQRIHLDLDELEALRLADVKHLYHEEAGRRMGLSRATFGRLLQSAREKVARALVMQHALLITDPDSHPHIHLTHELDE